MFNSPLKQLRKSLWLTEVPDNISVPAIGDEPASVIPTEKATVDEIAFAELALSREISALSRVRSSLSEIVSLARKQGARSTPQRWGVRCVWQGEIPARASAITNGGPRGFPARCPLRSR